jgi:hypothetical protein
VSIRNAVSTTPRTGGPPNGSCARLRQAGARLEPKDVTDHSNPHSGRTRGAIATSTIAVEKSQLPSYRPYEVGPRVVQSRLDPITDKPFVIVQTPLDFTAGPFLKINCEEGKALPPPSREARAKPPRSSQMARYRQGGDHVWQQVSGARSTGRGAGKDHRKAVGRPVEDPRANSRCCTSLST